MTFLISLAPVILKLIGEAGAPAFIQWVNKRLEQDRVDAETLKLWQSIAEYYMKKNNVAQEVRDSVRAQLARLGV